MRWSLCTWRCSFKLCCRTSELRVCGCCPQDKQDGDPAVDPSVEEQQEVPVLPRPRPPPPPPPPKPSSVSAGAPRSPTTPTPTPTGEPPSAQHSLGTELQSVLSSHKHTPPPHPPNIPCRGQVQHVRLCSVSALPVLQQPTSVRRLRRPLPPQSCQSQSQERESSEKQRRCDESDVSSFLFSSFLLGFTFSLPPSLQRSAVSVASPRSTPSASPASRGCV